MGLTENTVTKSTGLYPIRSLIFLLITIIIVLALALIGYLHWRNHLFVEQENIINHFHLNTVRHAARIKEEITQLRAHHAEEHLGDIDDYHKLRLPEFQFNHIQIISQQIDAIGKLAIRFQGVMAEDDSLGRLQRRLALDVTELNKIWQGSMVADSIDPFFESSNDAIVKLFNDVQIFQQLHSQKAKKLEQILILRKGFYDTLLYYLAATFALVGLFLTRRILGQIKKEINHRLSVEKAMNLQEMAVEKTVLALDVQKRSNRTMVMALADLAENRDSNTGEHVIRVARMAHEIASELQSQGNEVIDAQFMEQIAIASMLHDLGKVSTPDKVLLKPGPLNHSERAIMKLHPQVGGNLLEKIKATQESKSYLEMAVRIASYHHEQYKGGGYPKGLVAEEIPLEARIVAVSDVYDALTSWRPYKDPWPKEKAHAFIMAKSGTMFDPKVVAAFEIVMAAREETTVMHWEEAMSVGIAVLDNDHKTLIAVINQLSRSHQKGDPVLVELVLDELFNYTVRHFEREEILLMEKGYPEYITHKQIHNRFAQEVSGIRRSYFHNHSLQTSEQIYKLLKNWLRSHILVEDKSYSKWLFEQGTLGE
ncbi:MAG: bacteriohemerythrin [Magnetococcales bacterium]|nr:bacteriohemerythrin [Magnetococcales bacterium]